MQQEELQDANRRAADAESSAKENAALYATPAVLLRVSCPATSSHLRSRTCLRLDLLARLVLGCRKAAALREAEESRKSYATLSTKWAQDIKAFDERGA